MTRPVRHNIPGSAYHLISRFVDRDWFIRDEFDRAFYLKLLGRALAESDWRCFSFAVMSNHIHLGTIAGEEPLASWIRRVHGPFADWMNRKYDRLGPMFTRGPKDYAVPPEYVGKLIAYIHNNPVRAAVVSRASESSWTSHRAYLDRSRAPAWLDVDEGLVLAGFSDSVAFDQWVTKEPGDPSRVQIEKVRRAAQKRGAIEVGTPTGGAQPVVPLFGRPFAVVRLDPRLLVRRAAEALGLSEAALCSRRKSPEVVAGRRIAVYCGVTLGLTGTDMAAALGVSQQAVSKILGKGLEPYGLVAHGTAVLKRLVPNEAEQVVEVVPDPVQEPDSKLWK